MTALHELEARLLLKPHPFPAAPGSSAEAWGQIVLSVSGVSEPILSWEWDLSGSAEWYLDNRTALWSSRLAEVRPGESLADALVRHQQREFSDDDMDAEEEWLDTLYQFRSRHSLRFALRGADIPEIIIGCNGGAGEISCADPAKWRYAFDAGRFQGSFERELTQFLAKWRQQAADSTVASRAAELATRLAQVSSGPIASCE